jgi:anti-sigma B factor antagonist
MIVGAKTRSVEPDITVVELSGHLNLGNNLISIETLLRRLVTEGSRKMVLDLANLDYIDSAGIGMLVASNGHMDSSGGQLRIAGARGSVAKVFDVVHLERVLRMDADVGSACAQLS